MKVSAVAIVIMAFGGEYDQIVFSDNKSLELRCLLRPLLDCESLNGKPKIVITQFCRGSRHNAQQIIDSDDEQHSEVSLIISTTHSQIFFRLIP